MGDAKKLRKKYRTPSHPWQKERILEEKEHMKTYGLRNKKEVWRMVTVLKNYYKEAKRLVVLNNKQAEIERTSLLKKLHSYNLIRANAQIDEILEITIKDIMERRLQTILVRKALARNVKQARQFIVHGHVSVNGKKLSSPSYFVKEDELKSIVFLGSSSLAKLDHPERIQVEKPKEDVPSEDVKSEDIDK